MNLLRSLILFTLLSIFKLYAQTQNDFTFGAYLTSSNDSSTIYNDSLPKGAGINTPFQRVLFDVSPPRKPNNFTSLNSFDSIVAGNYFVNINGDDLQKKDWIFYFTHALYSKFKVYNDPIFKDNIKLKTKFGQLYGTEYWCTGYDTPAGDSIFITGPNYTQYMQYPFGWYKDAAPNPQLQYTVNFRLKLEDFILVEPKDPICKLRVKVYYFDKDNIYRSEIIKDSIFYGESFQSNDFSNFTIEYNYNKLKTVQNNKTIYPPPPTAYRDLGSTNQNYFNPNYKVQFEILWYGFGNLVADYIEVYDNKIYKDYFINDSSSIESSISEYVNRFSPLGNKLKYFHTIDEPHSVDSYIPIAKVQQILDRLNTGKKLITHFYPEWNGIRDSDNTFNYFNKLAYPSKLNFWFNGTYFANIKWEDSVVAAQSDDSIPHPRRLWGAKTNDESYSIYRKLGANNWQILD